MHWFTSDIILHFDGRSQFLKDVNIDLQKERERWREHLIGASREEHSSLSAPPWCCLVWMIKYPGRRSVSV